MRIISWNVNGIRSVLKKGFLEFVSKENPDILCLQEIKAREEEINLKEILKYFDFYLWNSGQKKGYAGTIVFSKIKPLKIWVDKELDLNEGRVIVAEFNSFFLVNVYVPNAQRGLTRLKERVGWDKKFLRFLCDLKKRKELIVCGDFNVAHNEIDLARSKDNVKNAGFTPEEREGFDKYINDGFVDAFRLFNNEGGNYSWWTYRFNARKKNIGWRIDYFLISEGIRKKVRKCEIFTNVMGSDHAPVLLELKT